MTQDEIIEMANEAGNGDEEWSIIAKQLFKHFPEETQRFAKLVAKRTKERIFKRAEIAAELAIEHALELEREACIDIVAMFGGSIEIESAIRARGQE
jgi:hypothetical protein